MFGIVSKRQESVYLQCMRAVHVAQTLAVHPNLLQLSHTFVAKLCRISRLQPSVSTAKLICFAGTTFQRLFPCKQLLGHDGMRVAGDLQKALEIDSGNLIFAWVQHRMFHAILLLCTALCQRSKKVSICGASEQCTLPRPPQGHQTCCNCHILLWQDFAGFHACT